MRYRACWKKGAILLQTLVMSVILSMIAVMLLKWIMARYIIVNRVSQSAVNTGGAQGYSALKVMTTGTPSNGSTTMGTKTVSFTNTSGTQYKTTVADEY